MPTAANGWAIASTNGAPGLSTRCTWRSVRPRSSSSSRLWLASTTSIVPLGANPRSASSPWWHSTDTPADAAAARRSAMRSGSGSRAIALAPIVGQGHGVAGDAELDDPATAGDVAEQVQLVVAGDALAVGHVLAHARQCGASGARSWRIEHRAALRRANDVPQLASLAGDEPVGRCAARSGERPRADRPPARPPAPHQRVPPRPAQPGAGVRRPSRADPGGQERRHRVDDGVPDLRGGPAAPRHVRVRPAAAGPRQVRDDGQGAGRARTGGARSCRPTSSRRASAATGTTSAACCPSAAADRRACSSRRLDELVGVVGAAREAPVLDLVERDVAAGRVPLGRRHVAAVHGVEVLARGAAALARRSVAGTARDANAYRGGDVVAVGSSLVPLLVARRAAA